MIGTAISLNRSAHRHTGSNSAVIEFLSGSARDM